MKNVKLKSGVYAVVNTTTGVVLAASRQREHARAQLQYAKSVADNPGEVKLLKMQPEKFIR